MNILDLINGNNYGVFNRKIAKAIGLNTSIVFSELVDKFQYFQNKNSLVTLKNQDGEWFYLTAETIEERTTLSEKEQRPCIEKLISLGFIKKVLAGLPSRRYFQIDYIKICEFFQDKINSTILAPGPNLIGQKVQTVLAPRPAIYKEPDKEPDKENKKKKSPVATPIVLNSETKKFEGIKEEDIKRWQDTFTAVNVRKEIQEALIWALGEPRSNYRKSLNTWMKNVNKAHISPLTQSKEVSVPASEDEVRRNREFAKHWENQFEKNPKNQYGVQAKPSQVTFIFPNGEGYSVEYNLKTEEFLKKCKKATTRLWPTS